MCEMNDARTKREYKAVNFFIGCINLCGFFLARSTEEHKVHVSVVYGHLDDTISDLSLYTVTERNQKRSRNKNT